VQVAGLVGAIVCVFIPALAYPAYKASTVDRTKTINDKEAKSDVWKEIDE
jgi:hypothetical protein